MTGTEATSASLTDSRASGPRRQVPGNMGFTYGVRGNMDLSNRFRVVWTSAKVFGALWTSMIAIGAEWISTTRLQKVGVLFE